MVDWRRESGGAVPKGWSQWQDGEANHEHWSREGPKAV